MHVMLRFALVPGMLLLAGAQFAVAESPLPDPVAPAVIGRPLEQIKPARPTPEKMATKPSAPRPAGAPAAAATPHGAKQALDDRADPRVRAAAVGKGKRFARKPLAPGAYIGDKHRSAVRKYYEDHPISVAAANWQVGEPVPRGARLAPVPEGLLARLPALPPGHRYVQLGGEVVLIAAGSRMVVDGVSRGAR